MLLLVLKGYRGINVAEVMSLRMVRVSRMSPLMLGTLVPLQVYQTVEDTMIISIKGDGNGIEIQFKVNWRSLRAVGKALLPVMTTLLTLLMAPEFVRFGAYLGWW